MMSALPLIDVNQLTVGETWPLLTSAISSAHFIAIDLVSSFQSLIIMCTPHAREISHIDIIMACILILQELSGLGRDRTKSAM